MASHVVLALYKFVIIEDPAGLRAELLELCRRAGIRGTLILAKEGVNGTVAGSRAGIDRLRERLAGDPRFDEMEAKESTAADQPFLRLKILEKSEIVTFRDDRVRPEERTGERVDADAWDDLIAREDVTVIDCRNEFEVEVGSFEGAINPGKKSFIDFKDFAAMELDPTRDRRVAMFCTGGIRCEKASAYLLAEGFERVYQLDGGILRYLEHRSADDSRFRGECFVFDRRVAVGHGLLEGSYRECHGCRFPVSRQDRESPEFEDGVSCPRCHANLTAERRERLRERRRQVILATARGVSHLGS